MYKRGYDTILRNLHLDRNQFLCLKQFCKEFLRCVYTCKAYVRCYYNIVPAGTQHRLLKSEGQNQLKNLDKQKEKKEKNFPLSSCKSLSVGVGQCTDFSISLLMSFFSLQPFTCFQKSGGGGGMIIHFFICTCLLREKRWGTPPRPLFRQVPKIPSFLQNYFNSVCHFLCATRVGGGGLEEKN